MASFKRCSMIKRKMLILGGSGYLGLNIARRFEAESRFDVTIGDIKEPATQGINFCKTDVLNLSSLDTLIKNQDIIINCTGQVTEPIYECLRINTEGTENITAMVSRYFKKLVHISSTSIYGTCDTVDEQTGPNPESPYSTCKAFAEFQVMKVKDTQPCILRLPNLYGEYQTKGLFAYLSKSYSTDKKLHFNNDGSLRRNFLYIADCAEAMFLAVEKELSGIFNVPAPDNYSLKEIIGLIESLKPVKFDIVYEQAKPIENISNVSFKAFSDQTGFVPKHSILSFINNSFL
jgi:nucleoside-diphosphate-sugar epimerase